MSLRHIKEEKLEGNFIDSDLFVHTVRIIK